MKHTALDPRYSDNPLVKSKLLEAEGYTSELKAMEDGLFLINLYPAGAAAGTLDDFLKFAKALLLEGDGHENLFKNKETLTEMLSPTLKYPGTGIDYNNHGFWSHEFNVQALGHGGNTIMYSSYLLFDPVTSVGMVIMSNQGGEITYNYGLPPMVFGDTGQMSYQEERSSISKMQGLYYSARTIRNGIGKMYTILGIMPYLGDGEENLNASFFGLADIRARQIAPDTFVTTQRISSQEVNILERYSDNNGERRFTSSYAETLEADADIWALLIITILYLIAVIWSLFVLIKNLVGLIIRRVKKKEKAFDSFKKYQIMLCIAIPLLLINILSVANKMLSMEATYSSLIVNIIVSIVLALIPLAYALLLFRKWPKMAKKRNQRVAYIISMCMGFVMTLAVVVLEMYRV